MTARIPTNTATMPPTRRYVVPRVRIRCQLALARDRQEHDEAAAHAALLDVARVAAVSTRNLAHQGEAKSHARVGLVMCAVAIEPVEDTLALSGGNAWPVVA